MNESRPNFDFYSQHDIETPIPTGWKGILGQVRHVREPTTCLLLVAVVAAYLGQNWLSFAAMTYVFILGCLEYLPWRDGQAPQKKFDLT